MALVSLLGLFLGAYLTLYKFGFIGTLTIRYAANDPDLANTHEGHSEEAGLPITFQSRNRCIVLAKPWGNRERFLRAFAKGEQDSVQQLATVIGLWNFAERKDWEIFVGDQKITAFLSYDEFKKMVEDLTAKTGAAPAVPNTDSAKGVTIPGAKKGP